MSRSSFLRFIATLAILCVPSFANAIHKCVDKNGKVTFSNVPCTTGQQRVGPETPGFVEGVTVKNLSQTMKEVSLPLGNNRKMLVPIPIEWGYSTQYPEAIKAPTLRVTTKGADPIVLLMSFIRIQDKSRQASIMVDEVISASTKHHSTIPSSRQLYSGELMPLRAEGVGRKAIYKDVALAKRSRLPRGEYVFMTSSGLVIEDVLISATILSNNASSENYNNALTALASVFYSVDNKQPEVQHKTVTKDEVGLLSLAYISEGFSASAVVKAQVAEYYSVTGKLPSSNAEAGIRIPESYAGVSLKSVRISGGGVITLTYDEKTGVNNGTIQLVPYVGNSALGLRWQCNTSSYKGIERMASQCNYING